jgi:NIPSNAP
MIFEERIYQIAYGKIPDLMSLYEKEGLPIQLPILGKLIGYFTTEIGTLNQVVHLWGYESLDDRLTRRARLMQEPVWRGFLDKIAPFIIHQENRILLPTSFSPLR